MNITSLIGIVAPQGGSSQTVVPPEGFGTLLAIGADAPLPDAHLPARQPIATPAPAAKADVLIVPGLIGALDETPADMTVPAPQVDTGLTPAPPIEQAAHELPASPSPAVEEKPDIPPLLTEPDLVPAPPVHIAMTRPAIDAVLPPIAPQDAESMNDAPALDEPAAELPGDEGQRSAPVLVTASAPSPVSPMAPPARPADWAPPPDVQVAAGDAPAPAPKAVINSVAEVSSGAAAQPVEADTGASTPPAMPGVVTARAQSFNEVYGHHRANTPVTPEPVVTARPGRMGREMGVEIARHVAAGRDEVMVRLDPPEMGRVDIRLSFDRDGSVRGVIAADSPNALDMLRKETGDLGRALADAGVRADAQSFRFDSRGRDPGQPGHQGRHADRGHEPMFDGDPAQETPVYRALRASGRVDLMA